MQQEAHTEFNGRKYRAVIEFYCPDDLTEEQIAEWLAFDLGGGSIASDHPAMDAQINDLEVVDLDAENVWYYTDWEAARPDGSRSGRGRRERAPRGEAT